MAEEGEASVNRKKIPRGFEAVAMAEEGEASVSRKKIRLFSSDHEIEESREGVPDAGAEEEDEGESQGNAGEHLESDGDEFVVEEEEEEEVDLGIEEAGSAESASPLVRTGDSAVTGVTVADADALECGVCFLALRPPIFQCELGHVVCSCCRDKLEATGNGGECCHVCGVGVATQGGYRRCHAMERLVDSIRVPCPYAAHGCVAMPAYHGRERHRRACPHAPCHCPGEACGFIGSAAALLDHFATAHDWPCTTKVRAGETFSVRLRDGFNFLLLADGGAAGDDDHGDTDTSSSVVTRLFLVNVTQERLCRAISVLWIHPPAAAAAADGVDQPLSARCKLVFSRYDDGSLCRSHYQKSDFQVACTDLSDGLPSHDGCFHFVVPNSVLGDDDTENAIHVKARIAIS